MKKNVLIAQSGGPSAVINSSLQGAIEHIKKHDNLFDRIYAGWHGVEGILKEELLDISAQPEDEIKLLRTTPAAGTIGTCRYKLIDENHADFERIIEVFKSHNIGYFFYIGGNDSMDTAHKISNLAKEKSYDLIVAGIPKTIDNDIGTFDLIDHTPGYGSCAKYWAHYMQCVNEENLGSSPCDPIIVIQAMGRKIGFIAAATRLFDLKRQTPLQIYLAENKLTLPELADKVNDQLKQDGRVMVIVNEGMDITDIGEAHDAFGHVEFSASKTTVAQEVTNYLNKVGLATRGMARCQNPGCDQRNSIIFASTVDLDEAYKLGAKAVEIASSGKTGYMSTILRAKDSIYRIKYDKVPLNLVANSEKLFPENWITKNKIDVTDDFVNYAQPLLGNDFVSVPLYGGLIRFAKFKPIFAEKKLKNYTPMAY